MGVVLRCRSEKCETERDDFLLTDRCRCVARNAGITPLGNGGCGYRRAWNIVVSMSMLLLLLSSLFGHKIHKHVHIKHFVN